MKKIFNERTISALLFVILMASMVYSSVMMFSVPSIERSIEVTGKVRSDYELMLSQCVLGILALLLPWLLKKKLHLNIPSSLLIMYAFHLFCTIFLGEVCTFFYRVPHWDTLLHAFSGVALGAIGFSLVGLLNKSESVSSSLSPIFVAMFAFGFSISINVIWEIYEFAADSILHTNMQKFALESGEFLGGQAALADTMKDLIIDFIGAFIMAAIGFVALKRKKGWLEKFLLTIERQ